MLKNRFGCRAEQPSSHVFALAVKVAAEVKVVAHYGLDKVTRSQRVALFRREGKPMSRNNGDKARHHRQRKAKLLKRSKWRKLKDLSFNPKSPQSRAAEVK